MAMPEPVPLLRDGKELRWREGPVVLVPVTLLASLVTSLRQAFGPRAASLLYMAGYQEGKRLARELKQDQAHDEDKDGRALFTLALGVLEEAGWGRFRIVNWDPMGNIIVVESDNPDMVRYMVDKGGRPGVGVEDLHRGLTSGVVSVIFSTEMDGYETHCRARGHPFCRLEIRPLADA